MEQAKAIKRWERIRDAMLRKADPYLHQPKRPDWKPEADLRDKPLSQLTPAEAESNLTRIQSDYPVRPVRLSDEALGKGR
jgi:hypothetical protein